MSDDKTKLLELRVAAEELAKNAVWNAFMEYIGTRESFFISELAGSKDIALPMSNGQLWQKCISEIRRMRGFIERLLSGQPEE